MCEHALAVAMYYQALKREENLAPIYKEPVPLPSPPETSQLQSIKLAEGAISMRLILLLPPNFMVSVKRGAIAVKLNVAVGREIFSLGKLESDKTYTVAPSQLSALVCIESWCAGKLPSFIQLSASQLLQLLNHLKNEPVIYWLKIRTLPYNGLMVLSWVFMNFW